MEQGREEQNDVVAPSRGADVVRIDNPALFLLPVVFGSDEFQHQLISL